MANCRSEIIYQKEDVVFTKCCDCGRLTLLFKHMIIHFDDFNYNAFSRYLDCMEFEYEKYPFPDGMDRVIIETYHPDVQFTLLEEEFYRLKAFVIEVNTHLQLIEMMDRM